MLTKTCKETSFDVKYTPTEHSNYPTKVASYCLPSCVVEHYSDMHIIQRLFEGDWLVI